MASISKQRGKRGQTTFRVQIRRAGAPAITATFPTKDEAENWGKSQEQRLAQMKHSDTAEGFGKTLSELIDRLIEDAGHDANIKLCHTKRQQIEWWRDELGEIRLAEISSARINDRLRKLARGNKQLGGKTVRNGNKPRGAATVNRYRASLSAVFRYAVKELQWLGTNPCHNTTSRTIPTGRTRTLNDAERIALLTACDQSEWSALPVLVRLALATGGRAGELMGLRWCDVDLVNGELTFLNTKNNDTRVVPVIGDALDHLKDWSKIRPIDSVFAQTFQRKHWYTALDMAGIKDFRFHDLRHCTGTYLLRAGVPTVTIAAVLGHRTLAMVKRYAHSDTSMQRDALERMHRSLER